MDCLRSEGRGILLVILGGFTSACGGDWQDEDVSQRTDELAYYVGVTYWNTGDTIPVCITGPNTADQSLAQNVIQSTWGQVMGLDLNFVGSCPTTVPSNYISIYLRSNTGNGSGGWGAAGLGGRLGADPLWGNRTDIQLFAQRDRFISDNRYRAIILHELGHVLGFYHESDRHDNLGECVSEPSPGATTGWITHYDPRSIMSPCSVFYGRDPEDFMPTHLDELGAEMMYPQGYGRKPVLVGGFGNSGGFQYVVRTGAAYELLPDWLYRGAHESAFGAVLWETDGATAGTDLVLNQTFNAEGPYWFDVALYDMRNRLHPFTGGIHALVDNSKHTSIVMSIL
jgi:hypothetical protein